VGTRIRFSDQNGFTLIELSVVIVIISLFAMFAIPKLSNSGGFRLKNAGRHLAKTISYLHTQAMAKGQFLRLDFNLKKGKYFVSFLNEDGKFEKSELTFFKSSKLKSGISVESFTTLFNGTYSGDSAYIHFMPEGFSEKAVIVLKDKKGRELSLILNPLTGKVKLEQGAVEFNPIDIQALYSRWLEVFA